MEPIITCIDDNEKALKNYEASLRCDKEDINNKLILDYPTVYIHNWPETDTYEVYVGEANSVIRRTKEHYKKKNDWNLLIKGRRY